MDKKTILFFGDSLTFCHDPNTNDRMDYENRWTTLVENKFSDTFRFIIEGQGGRTIDQDDGIEGKNGLKAFTQAIYSHIYLDYIFLMLGTNELKDRFRRSSKEIALKLLKYNEELKKWGIDWEEINLPKVVLIAPPKINEKYIPNWGITNAQQISNDLSEDYKKVSEKLNWDFIDASEIKVSEKDGVHLDEIGNKKLADLVINYLEKTS